MIELYYTVQVILEWLGDGTAEPDYKHLTVYYIEDNKPKQLFETSFAIEENAVNEINLYIELNDLPEIGDKTYTLTQL